jgi:serine/threonine-protein kinase
MEPVLRDFEDAWKAGASPRIADYLVRLPEARLPLLVELVHLDLELRIKAGDTVCAQEYLDRFPEVAADPQLAGEVLAAEHGLTPRGKEHLPTAVGESITAISRVVLQTEPGDGPLATESRPPNGIAGASGRLGRYQLFGEIGRGGMGAILLGRDDDLGRDLAVKVLLESHRNKPELIRRFVEEAQIGGQLQHPGIVPVYELGTSVDLPFFTMKLVRGQKLEALLAGRQSPTEDVPRFVGIFEQLCHAMAYAHSRGVIHRDLKPANIMIGSFGEVQVMDWGLAKVLSPHDRFNQDNTGAGLEAVAGVVKTVRSDSDQGMSQPGDVLGTLAYMAPEQARGEVHSVDERVDVFGLGAILCEILTGSAAFTGRMGDEVYQRAQRGDLSEAFERLRRSGAEGELIQLAQDCLDPDRDNRPRHAGEVARRMTAHLAGVQDRLRRAELARAEASARAVEERKRRRVTIALAASVTATALLAGVGWVSFREQGARRRTATTRSVNAAVLEATRLQEQAQATNDLTKWDQALDKADKAEGVLASGEADLALRDQVTALKASIERGRAAAQEKARQLEREKALLERLETVRGKRSEHWDWNRTDAEYEAAFREFDLDLDRLDDAEAAAWVERQSAPREISFYLDDWGMRPRGVRRRTEAHWQRLAAAARAGDPDPWRDELRLRAARDDLAGLRRMADDEKTLGAQEPRSLVLLAEALRARGDGGRVGPVLGRAWHLKPNDFWVNFELGSSWDPNSPAPPDQAIRFLTAAVALRPRSFAAHTNLGPALAKNGQLDEAIAEFRAAIELDPNNHRAHANLGLALSMKGRFEEAVAECRTAIRLKDAPPFRTNLAGALRQLGRLEAASAEYREVVRLAPGDPDAHYNLAKALLSLGKLGDAITELRATLKLQGDHQGAHAFLGDALFRAKKLDEAIAEFRELLRLDANSASACCNLAHVLQETGKSREALEYFRKGHALGSKLPGWSYPALECARQAERFVELEERLPAFLRGERKPSGSVEAISLARLCYFRQLYRPSVRFWLEAFELEPVVQELRTGNRNQAARAAALAGCGKGRDDPPLAENERKGLLAQARAWLKADLAEATKGLQTKEPDAGTSVKETIARWREDPDLAGVRDPSALEGLSADEVNAWRALWSDFEAMLRDT